MLTKSGAKLLDFGLAKPVSASVTGSALSSSLTPSTPTMTVAAMSVQSSPLTQRGMMVGTFQYLAPEVLHGKEADARSDIFALGAVLYEMITGKHAFAGKSQLSVMTAILEKEPERMAQAPPALEHVVQTCLTKDPAERLQRASEVARELRWVAEGPALVHVKEPTTARTVSRPWVWWGVTALSLACATLFAVLYVEVASKPLQMIRSYIPPPEKASFAFNGDTAGPVVIAPDGSAIGFVADDVDGKHMLWVQELSTNSARVLAGTEGATFPFWSPDGRSLGFFGAGKLKTIDVGGGAVTTLCEALQGRGGSWNRDGTIIFSASFQGPIYKIPESGGAPVPITKVDVSRHDSHRWPAFLPDGKHFLYLAVTHRNLSDPADAIYLGSLDGTEATLVMPSVTAAVFSQGHILFLRGNQLMAQEFDTASRKLLGTAIKIADDVQNDPTTWHGTFDSSKNGTLVHGIGGGAESQVTWFDRSGKPLANVGKPEVNLFNLRLSSGGDRLIAEMLGDAWVYDLARNVKTRLTFSGVQSPVWSPNGDWVAFSGPPPPRDLSAGGTIQRKHSDGSGEVETLLTSQNATPNDWSPDGRFLLYTEGLSGADQNVMALPLSGDRQPIAVTTQRGGVDQSDAAFSPDSRWITYASTESGRSEVYVMPFQHGGGRWQVSTAGGDHSRWNPSGKEIFYMALDRTLMAVPITLGQESVKLGSPQPLFRTSVIAPNTSSFDVSADGKRFVVDSTIQSHNAPVAIIVNWTAVLKK